MSENYITFSDETIHKYKGHIPLSLFEHEKSRLEELKEQCMDKGWYDKGQGKPIPYDVFKCVERFFMLNKGTRFKIYPTLEGGIQLEREGSDSNLSIEFASDGFAEIHYYKFSTDETNRTVTRSEDLYINYSGILELILMDLAEYQQTK